MAEEQNKWANFDISTQKPKKGKKTSGAQNKITQQAAKPLEERKEPVNVQLPSTDAVKEKLKQPEDQVRVLKDQTDRRPRQQKDIIEGYIPYEFRTDVEERYPPVVITSTYSMKVHTKQIFTNHYKISVNLKKNTQILMFKVDFGAQIEDDSHEHEILKKIKTDLQEKYGIYLFSDSHIFCTKKVNLSYFSAPFEGQTHELTISLVDSFDLSVQSTKTRKVTDRLLSYIGKVFKKALAKQNYSKQA